MTDPAPSPPDLPSRIGSIMLFAAWIVGLALLVLLFYRFIQHEQHPNRELRVAHDGERIEVTLERNRIGHYLAPGEINGHAVTFLVDTGASAVALPLKLAQELELPLRAGSTSRTANGVVRTWTTRLDTVNVGGLVATNVHAVVMPNMPGDEALLGMTYLRRVELTQRDGYLTLAAPARARQ